jgi:hypothetical protein
MQKMLNIQQTSKTYARLDALRAVSLQIPAGDAFGLNWPERRRRDHTDQVPVCFSWKASYDQVSKSVG